MKTILSLLIVIMVSGVAIAQDVEPASTEVPESFKKTISDFLSHFSYSGTISTPSMAANALGSINGKTLGDVGLGDLNISYKINPNLRIGISATGSLGNCSEGYYTAEGTFVEIEDMDDMDDEDVEEDTDNADGTAEADDHECDNDFEVQNLMATVSYKFSDKVPVVVQVAGGYSLGQKAPAISTFVGYNQAIWSELGITAGLRYSTVLSQIPADAINFTRSGLKAEVGLSWGF